MVAHTTLWLTSPNETKYTVHSQLVLYVKCIWCIPSTAMIVYLSNFTISLNIQEGPKDTGEISDM